jgi:hypothetical protein
MGAGTQVTGWYGDSRYNTAYICVPIYTPYPEMGKFSLTRLFIDLINYT